MGATYIVERATDSKKFIAKINKFPELFDRAKDEALRLSRLNSQHIVKY